MKQRIRNFFIIIVLIIAAFLLQYSVFIRIPAVNYAPNLMLILTFSFAYIRNKNAGMVVGFFSGLIIDIFYCEVIGYNALILLIVGYICGSLKKVYYSDSLFTQLFILSLCDLSCSLVYYFFWFILRSRFAFVHNLLYVIIPEFLFTLLAGIILIRPLSAMIRKMYLFDTEAENA